MKSLKECLRLSASVKIYVPSTMDVDKAIDSAKFVDEALAFLTEEYGGATASLAEGAWLANSGAIVRESVTLLNAFCAPEALAASEGRLLAFCARLKAAMRQESVALEVNNELYLV
jgi:hypothetical protein